MRFSEATNELAAALSKAQGAMQAAVKDAKGNFSTYATMSAIWDVARGPLAENALAVVQCPEAGEAGIVVHCRIMHSSGQWLETELRMPVNKNDAHGVGSAVSYACRYQLRSVLGIPSDDDDGQAAVKSAPKQDQKQDQDARGNRPQQAQQQSQPQQPVKQAPAQPTPAQPTAQPVDSTAISKAQAVNIADLKARIIGTRKMADTDWRPFLAFSLQDDTLTDPTAKPNRVQAEAFISRFGKVEKDGLALDVPALESCLNDWDEALERARVEALDTVDVSVDVPVDVATSEPASAPQAPAAQKDFDRLRA